MTAYIDFECKEFEVRDFFLTTLEQTCRVQLNDSEAKITQSTSEGRIFLEVQQDELSNFFDCLPEQQDNNWGQEKNLLQREISGLKAQLAKAPAKRDPSPARDKSLKSELDKLSWTLNNAQKDLSRKAGIINNQDFQLKKFSLMLNNAQQDLSKKDTIIKSQDFQLKKVGSMMNNAPKDLSEKDGIIKSQNFLLVKLKGEIEALRKELEEKESVILAERKMLAVARTNMEWEMEGLLQTEREDRQGHLNKTKADLQKTKEDLQKTKEDLQKTKDEAKPHQAQLNEQRAEIEKLTADLKKSEDLLKTEKQLFQTRIVTIREDTDKFMSDCLPAMEELRADKSQIMAALKYSEEELKFVHDMWREDKSSHLAELEKSQRSHLVQLEKQDEVHKTTMADLKKNFEDQLASDRLLWQQEKTSLLEETEKTSSSFAAQLHEDKSSHLAELETSQRSHLAQLKMQDEEHKTIMADLKTKLEDQLASDRLLWQKEKTSLLEETVKTSSSFAAQLHEQKQSNDTLVAALETAEQQIESHRIECQESSLLQAKATESVQQTLQEKEQEWTTTESSLRSQLADLENQIAKKKRTKWYRKIF
ncbi:uncharacterized protein LOC141762267 [Sebastes fasciatus]|uniref:uncharacterized protein LOC141762267 n=1 Tax=Sebastes fasciatus TaxID=394691 RepID=UPI003D9EE83E